MTVYISRDVSDTELAHYGVMGMKWGVRKDPRATVERVNSQTSEWRAKASGLRSKRDAYISKKANARSSARKMIRADRLKNKALKKDAKGDLIKGAKFRAKAAKLEQKATGVNHKSNKMLYKAQKYEAKANRLNKATDREIQKQQNKYDKNIEKQESRLNKTAGKYQRIKGREALARYQNRPAYIQYYKNNVNRVRKKVGRLVDKALFYGHNVKHDPMIDMFNIRSKSKSGKGTYKELTGNHNTSFIRN